jgi:hypothetical protein
MNPDAPQHHPVFYTEPHGEVRDGVTASRRAWASLSSQTHEQRAFSSWATSSKAAVSEGLLCTSPGSCHSTGAGGLYHCGPQSLAWQRRKQEIGFGHRSHCQLLGKNLSWLSSHCCPQMQHTTPSTVLTPKPNLRSKMLQAPNIFLAHLVCESCPELTRGYFSLYLFLLV